MLTTLSPDHVRRLSLGIRDHAALLTPDPDLCRKVLERDDHVCHVCGTRTVEGSEIDHTAGHVPCDAGKLKTICQFCHNLKHPLWAAARGRIVPIHAPDMSQIDLHRLAWAMVAWRSEDAWSSHCEAIREALQERHEKFRSATGCRSAEAFFEGILTGMISMGRERAAKAVLQMDGFTRFIPFEVLVPLAEVDDRRRHQRASRLSTWSIGGFRKIAVTAGEGIRRDVGAAEPAQEADRGTA